ncbi:hypothetical protein MVES1_000728 [Malassezia vespertilionis]|nr:uncharacterized protein MVES1_000728 [Malassezia vespertilionis]WFD05398.1 hypothetical protein MVES1_000728 [Malassezia vespertilionis]
MSVGVPFAGSTGIGFTTEGDSDPSEYLDKEQEELSDRGISNDKSEGKLPLFRIW